jgi:Raf kinase inhibitor-like YbhB/YbcL family protein
MFASLRGRFLSVAGLVLLAACAPTDVAQIPSAAAFVLTSPAFVEGGIIPLRFTGDGESISPPLEWRGVPAGTRSLALAVVDPDVPWGQDVPVYGILPPPATQPADLFVHWLVTNLPATTESLPEGASPGNMPAGLGELRTSFALFGAPANQYGGPAPPPGTKAHAYRFVLYALDVERIDGMSAEAGYADLMTAMAGRVLDVAMLTGYFGH